MSDIAQKLESLIGSTDVCAWENLDAAMQARLAAAVTPQTQVAGVVYPQTPDALAEVVRCARLNQWSILPCGSGSKLHWGGLADRAHVAVSTARLNRLIDHAVGDLTVTAEAGMPFATLQARLQQQGQCLAIAPSYPETATLGGMVATADAGALRHRYGGIRDMLIGLSIVRTDGERAKAGGRVVKNVAGYDLMKLFTGSYGSLGLIEQVTFRVYPVPPASQTIALIGETAAIAQATAALLRSALTPVALELLPAPPIAALALDADMGLLCQFQSMEVSVAKQTEQLLNLAQALQLRAICLSGTDESQLWQQLRQSLETGPTEPAITCKIGVLPAQAVETLAKIKAMTAALEAGWLQAGSGLGLLRFNSSLSAATLLELRQLCQQQGGFLTILAAPIALKQQLDVWGYTGSAFNLLNALKHQFDPDNRFSPGRFVGQL